MLKKTLVVAFVAGGLMALSGGGEASAQVSDPCSGTAGSFVCESNIINSTKFGFNPETNLLKAVRNLDAANGPCFTCPTHFKNTPGALTNSMFDVVRENSDADLGDKSRTPDMQGQDDIPDGKKNNDGNGENDLGAFRFSLPLPAQNFLSAGAAVVADPLSPDAPIQDGPTPEGGVFGKGGVATEFDSTFVYFGDALHSSAFTQTMGQTTVIGGFKDVEIQTVQFDASVGDINDVNNVENNRRDTTTGGDAGGTLRWEQTIQEDSFILGKTSGSFVYDSPSLDEKALAIPNSIAPSP